MDTFEHTHKFAQYCADECRTHRHPIRGAGNGAVICLNRIVVKDLRRATFGAAVPMVRRAVTSIWTSPQDHSSDYFADSDLRAERAVPGLRGAQLGDQGPADDQGEGPAWQSGPGREAPIGFSQAGVAVQLGARSGSWKIQLDVPWPAVEFLADALEILRRQPGIWSTARVGSVGNMGAKPGLTRDAGFVDGHGRSWVQVVTWPAAADCYRVARRRRAGMATGAVQHPLRGRKRVVRCPPSMICRTADSGCWGCSELLLTATPACSPERLSGSWHIWP